MMRPVLILTTAIALCAASAASGQILSPSDTSRDAARRGQGVVTPQTGGDNNTVPGRGADTNASDRPRATLPEWIEQPVAVPMIGRPASASAGLTAHQRRCAQRYRTYTPATDRYTARPGVERRCLL